MRRDQVSRGVEADLTFGMDVLRRFGDGLITGIVGMVTVVNGSNDCEILALLCCVESSGLVFTSINLIWN